MKSCLSATKMVAPVIMAFGNDTQKEFYLPRIALLEHYWCQGYSEPGSGSDLASQDPRGSRRRRLCRERPEDVDNRSAGCGTGYSPSGSNFSNTGRKQDGITFLCIDMRTPGITVRPIITIDGAHEINELWFEDARAGQEFDWRGRRRVGLAPSTCLRRSA